MIIRPKGLLLSRKGKNTVNKESDSIDAKIKKGIEEYNSGKMLTLQLYEYMIILKIKKIC